VISGGIGRNVALVKKIEERLDGLKAKLPPEPMIVGAVGAAMFALDRAKQGDEARPTKQAARRPAARKEP
jgi:activator of 2-hydroxyglutaryl-CoA dehydratase